MDAKLLGQSPIGTLVSIGGYDPRAGRDYHASAYVPDDLPHNVELSGSTHLAVANAAAAVARADQAARQLPNPRLLVRPSIRREAVSTSALEGTYAAFTDVLEADFKDRAQLSASVAEVLNYVRAAEEAIAWVGERPITLALLQHLQGVLVRGTPSETRDAGRVRTTQVFIGLNSANVEDARFVPAPPDHRLRDGLLAWEGWINGGQEMHTLVKMALGHYQFDTLHPFNDGNGRLGRLVVILQLMAAGELQLPILNLSPWLEVRRRAYQDHLLDVSVTGDYNPWVSFFCQAVEAQASEAMRQVSGLIEIKQKFMDQLRALRAKGVSLQIAEDLIGYPMLTVRDAADRYGVTYQAANQAVAKLVELGILQQRSEGNYGRIFACNDVLRVMQLPPPPQQTALPVS
ncbi:Fic family protein [Streptomyces sp. S584]|uniref:Fic family protein n=1 Tax=Streptomyces sp. S584 TaxID=3096010 RepID=UPI002AFEEDB1|nr:Fic/DOC family N-terminal domain-containing protein [Streptomyces sp. S584]